jgi:uncharacterized protein (DUF1800 family)
MCKSQVPLSRRAVAAGLVFGLTAVSLAACGGGGGGGGGSGAASNPIANLFSGSSSSSAAPPTQAEAGRFLAQATFGATPADITGLTGSTYAAWIDQQEAMPRSSTHLAHMDARLTQLQAANASATLSANQFQESFWQQAATAPDQLRQRVAFALSEIFVTSFTSGREDPRGMAAYYDMLENDAFGNFRNLLTDVTYSPAMGIYLTYQGNQKENAQTGRNPDQNYAREVMQLMTIGLYKLNTDGTPQKDLLGNIQPTYTTDDVIGLSKVFTGLSFYNPSPTNTTFAGGNKDGAAYTHAMIVYNGYHSTSAKSFLGTTIAASSTADGDADIKAALDALFNHPNVGPFISRQLIQRLVTSNPSPAYVQRVATVFNDNGSGVRGDLGAVVKAILLDNEARTAPGTADYGKVREPVVRLGNWMRSFGATSQSGNWLMTSTAGQNMLGQAALTSPSVFDFFRPGYVPADTRLGAKGLQAPEFQLVDEVSIPAYANLLVNTLSSGIGTVAAGTTTHDINSAYANETALADTPSSLVDHVELLLGTQLSAQAKSNIVSAVAGVTVPATAGDAARLNRVRLAILMVMASPDYIAQR